MVEMLFNSSDYNKPLIKSLLESKSLYGKKHIIIEDINREPLNYKKFVIKSFVLSRHIKKISGSKDYNGLMLPNSVAAAVSFFAMQAACRIPAMLNFSGGYTNISHCAKLAKLKVIYTSRQFIEKAKLQDVIAQLKVDGLKIIYLEDLKNEITIFTN